MKKRRHWAVLPALLVGIAVVGVAWTLGYGAFFSSHKESLPDESQSASPPPPPGSIAVTVAPVHLRPVQRTVISVGTLHAFEQVTVSAKVEGRVRRIVHDVGDRVKPGDLLLEIDPTDTDLSVLQAQSALDVELAKLGLTAPATAEFDVAKLPSVIEASVKLGRIRERMERVRSLVERGAMSRDELSNLTSDFRSLQAEHDNQILLAKSGLATIQMKQQALAIVRQQLKDTQIAAPQPTLIPFAARDTTYAITGRTAAEGSFLRAGTEVFRLVMDRMLKLRLPVPDRYVADVQLGQKTKITTAAYDTTFEGIVRRINPAVDPTTRTFEVEIQLANTNGALKSGSFAKAAIQTRYDAGVPTVPLEAIVRFAGITKIFVIDKGKARELQVGIGTATDRWVEITGTRLPKNAQVITSGQTVLSDGAPIYVRPSSITARGTEHQPARD